jgi:hypothetical protein
MVNDTKGVSESKTIFQILFYETSASRQPNHELGSVCQAIIWASSELRDRPVPLLYLGDEIFTNYLSSKIQKHFLSQINISVIVLISKEKMHDYISNAQVCLSFIPL